MSPQKRHRKDSNLINYTANTFADTAKPLFFVDVTQHVYCVNTCILAVAIHFAWGIFVYRKSPIVAATEENIFFSGIDANQVEHWLMFWDVHIFTQLFCILYFVLRGE